MDKTLRERHEIAVFKIEELLRELRKLDVDSLHEIDSPSEEEVASIEKVEEHLSISLNVLRGEL